MSIISIFLEHPRTVDETYIEHMRFALLAAIKLQAAVIALLVHSVFPFLFTDNASKCLYDLINEIELRAQKRR